MWNNQSNTDPEFIKGFFRDLAPAYDKFNKISSLFLDGYWRDKAASFARPGMSVLDLCTGTGDLAFKIAKKIGPQGTLVGVDFTEEMLDLAERKKQKMCPGSNISFRLSYAEDLPFKSESFDLVVSAFAMRNVIANLERVLKEMFRVLKPNGQILILDFSRPQMPMLRLLHLLYLKTVIPIDGKIILGSRWRSNYLEDSILNFFSPKDFCKELSNVGFSHARYLPLTFGIVGIYRARKVI